MKQIQDFLNGKKTYITAILFGIYNIGLALGYWTADATIVTAINTLFGAFGLGFLRSGIKKTE